MVLAAGAIGEAVPLVALSLVLVRDRAPLQSLIVLAFATGAVGSIVLAARDPDSSQPIRRKYGPWMFQAFSLVARFKFLRGTAFDIFGRAPDRRLERQLIADYEGLIGQILAGLSHDRHRLAVALASIPEQIRGYGHVKHAHLDKAMKRRAELLSEFQVPTTRQTAAE
jgi:indolepyruvate ferredoxin oxidoreductase